MIDAARELFWLHGSGPVGFTTEDLPQAQITYRRVFEKGGPGSRDMQEALLNLIAASEEVTSIPFWLHVLDQTKPRDQFRVQRFRMALAALARLAIRRHEVAAYDALRQVAHHDNPEIRGTAVYYLGRAYDEARQEIPDDVISELKAIASKDPAFAPRFQARNVLKAAGQPIPLDNPGGVYAFKVRFLFAKRIYRVIEARSEQTLDHLQRAIQQAIDWDNDHLYAFYLNNRKYDHRYGFACPYEEDRPPWTTEAIIGQLGLVLKHKFLYHFDYGDDHLFEIEVVDIRPEAYEGEYPRLVDSYGKAPEQYG
jgi:hypothetical protein